MTLSEQTANLNPSAYSEPCALPQTICRLQESQLWLYNGFFFSIIKPQVLCLDILCPISMKRGMENLWCELPTFLKIQLEKGQDAEFNIFCGGTFISFIVEIILCFKNK